jgi:hypothetical protein
MTDLLHRLALEPRTSNVSVQDSVLVSGSNEDISHAIKVPVISERPSRKTPVIPDVHLKARPVTRNNEDNWIDAYNADFA